MRKTFVIILCIALAIAVTACGSKTDDVKDVPAPLPPPPQPPVVVEPEPEPVPPEEAPAETETTEIDPTEIFKGEVTGMPVVELSGAMCDISDKKVTFTLKNIGEKAWNIDQDIPWPAPPDIGQLKIFFNNREMNGLSAVYYVPGTDVRYFGPNEKFSDNCGGKAVVAVGESVTCTVFPVPITGENQFEQTSRFLIIAPGGQTMYNFVCGA